MLKRVGEDSSTNEPIEIYPHGYNVGHKDRGGEYCTAEDRLIGSLQEDDWWTVDIRDTNPAIVVEQPQETPARSETPTCPGLAPLEGSSGTVFEKQEIFTVRGFLSNSLFIQYSFIH
jgi:hypothetical protein